MVLFTVSLVLASCNKEVKDEFKIVNHETELVDGRFTNFNLPKCDRLVSNSIIFEGDSISYVGKLHNRLLDSLLKTPFIFNDFISNDFISTSIFGSRFNEYYSTGDLNWFVNEIYNLEIKPMIDQAFDDQIIKYETKVFLTEIANSSITHNFDPQYFINALNQIDSNTIDFLICSTVLSITDYSNCYWNSNIDSSKRWIWLQAALAADCLAGIGQTILLAYESYENNWQYDVDDWLKRAGRSAALGSSFGRFVRF